MRDLNNRVVKRAFLAGALSLSLFVADATQPNIVLIMTDDQGWGQTCRSHLFVRVAAIELTVPAA
jgi:hypothetical protein